MQTIQDSTEDQVVFAQSEVPIVTGEILNALRTTGKTLCVVGDGYTLNVSGKEVKSTTSEIDTAITFTESEEGLEFELDNGRTLPCAVQLELDVSTYSRLYLYNTISNKWQFLNSYKDGVITADTAGRYLLTNQNLRFGDINWTFFIAGGVVVILIAIATSCSRSATGSGKLLFPCIYDRPLHNISCNGRFCVLDDFEMIFTVVQKRLWAVLNHFFTRRDAL